MLLFVALAHAALPWECPALTAPPDAPPFLTDAGLEDSFWALDALAEPWVDPACAWSDVTMDSGAIESTCVTTAGAFVTLTTWEGAATGEDFPTDHRSWSNWGLVVELPEGADTWDRLALSLDSSGSDSGSASGGGSTWSAEWTGAVLAFPDDASFTLATSRSCLYSECDTTTTIDTPACDWSWGTGDGMGNTWVRAGGHEAELVTYWYQCGDYPTMASFDDVLFGSVDPTTWALDEVDLDGWSVDKGDCDDADPTIYPCAPEIPADGIDQDCDGADAVDAADTGDTADTAAPADTAEDTAAAADTAAEPPSAAPSADDAEDAEHGGCGAAAWLLLGGLALAPARRRRA